ncbi:MAG: hypothetical protein ACLRSW_15480 [Christensenellaceae bacterium]
MSRIAMETEKLLIYCRARQSDRLSDEMVDEVVYPDSEYKIYELANALSRKNYSAYTRILSELSSKGFDEISLLNSLCYYFKGLYEASLTRGGDREVAAALGIKEYARAKPRAGGEVSQRGAAALLQEHLRSDRRDQMRRAYRRLRAENGYRAAVFRGKKGGIVLLIRRIKENAVKNAQSYKKTLYF